MEAWGACLGNSTHTRITSSENLGDSLYATAQKWNTIRNHGMNAVVTDNAPNAVGAVAYSGLDPHLGCFAHNLNLVANKALETTVISRILARVRRIVTYFHRSNIATQALKEKQVQLGMAPTTAKAKKLIIDVKTRWNSSFDMLQRYTELELAVLAALHSSDVKKSQTAVDTLSAADIVQINKAIIVLQPLKTATVALCEASMPTASMILPLQHTILTNMAAQPATNDPQLSKGPSSMEHEMKTAITKKLSKCYQKEATQKLLKAVTVMDPRFRTLPFLSTHEKEEVYACLLQDIKKFTEVVNQGRPLLFPVVKEEHDHGTNSASSVIENSTESERTLCPPLPTLEPPSSQPPSQASPVPHQYSSDDENMAANESQGAMSQLFGDVYITKVEAGNDRSIEEEINQYRHLQCIPIHHNPLSWWKQNQSAFPHLANYAKCLLAIPGTSVPSERVFSVAGNIVTAQRANLSPDNVDILIFLKKNLKLESGWAHLFVSSYQPSGISFKFLWNGQ